jgi:hypothetical protein
MSANNSKFDAAALVEEYLENGIYNPIGQICQTTDCKTFSYVELNEALNDAETWYWQDDDNNDNNDEDEITRK